MRVECEVEYTELDGSHGQEVPGVIVSCTRCSHSEQSFGQGEASVRRCLALLRENCPNGEENFYVDAETV
jgi:hypothetical protein